jgi:hypothetical protein
MPLSYSKFAFPDNIKTIQLDNKEFTFEEASKYLKTHPRSDDVICFSVSLTKEEIIELEENFYKVLEDLKIKQTMVKQYLRDLQRQKKQIFEND